MTWCISLVEALLFNLLKSAVIILKFEQCCFTMIQTYWQAL